MKKASHREHFLIICNWRVEQIATQENDSLLQGHSEVIVLLKSYKLSPHMYI